MCARVSVCVFFFVLIIFTISEIKIFSADMALHTHWWWLRRDPPHMIVKRFGCTTIHKKALYKCIIHSFIHIN